MLNLSVPVFSAQAFQTLTTAMILTWIVLAVCWLGLSMVVSGVHNLSDKASSRIKRAGAVLAVLLHFMILVMAILGVVILSRTT